MQEKRLKISILIPCHNEEKSIFRSVQSCLKQTRPADEVVVVNDGSTDKSLEILTSFGDAIKIVNLEKATGSKSYAQEYGLQFVTGDIFIATDGDTLLGANFVELMEADFQNEEIAAVSGYVKSLKHNWLTACRAFEYALGQNVHKLAQSYVNFMFVIPGAAGAFRTELFKANIHFDHDTITEDLDFTYKFHKLGLKLAYDRNAISYTQDPATLPQYINQIRRWLGGGWQNLLKHFTVINEPVRALELSLIYIEGLVFSALLLIMPFINWYYSVYFLGAYFVVIVALAVWAAIKERRLDILWVIPAFPLVIFINAWIFLEQFIKEIILGRKNLVWFHPDRVNL